MPLSSLEILRLSGIFGDLDETELKTLTRNCQEAQYGHQDFIFLEGDPALWLWLVKSGQVKILKHSGTGREFAVEILSPGEVFGGVAVVDQKPYPASAQAVERVTALKISREHFLGVVRSHPDVVRQMMLVIAERLRTSREIMTSLAGDPVEQRLAIALLRVAQRAGRAEGTGIRLTFHLTRQSLADLAGTTVETTIRVLSRWSKAGMLRSGEGPLFIANARALTSLAKGEGESGS